MQIPLLVLSVCVYLSVSLLLNTNDLTSSAGASARIRGERFMKSHQSGSSSFGRATWPSTQTTLGTLHGSCTCRQSIKLKGLDYRPPAAKSLGPSCVYQHIMLAFHEEWWNKEMLFAQSISVWQKNVPPVVSASGLPRGSNSCGPSKPRGPRQHGRDLGSGDWRASRKTTLGTARGSQAARCT